MKTIHRNWKELINDCILIIFVSGTIGIALKFTTFFDRWVYFPWFPNVFDALFLVTSVIYLTTRSRAPQKIGLKWTSTQSFSYQPDVKNK